MINTDSDSDDYSSSDGSNIDDTEVHFFRIGIEVGSTFRFFEGDSTSETIYIDSPQLERFRVLSSLSGNSTFNLTNGHGELSKVYGRPVLAYCHFAVGTNACTLEFNDNETDAGFSQNFTYVNSGTIQFSTSTRFDFAHDWGVFGEGICIEGSMTSDEIDRVKGYMAHTWGYESYMLRDDNAYKSNPPAA